MAGSERPELAVMGIRLADRTDGVEAVHHPRHSLDLCFGPRRRRYAQARRARLSGRVATEAISGRSFDPLDTGVSQRPFGISATEGLTLQYLAVRKQLFTVARCGNLPGIDAFGRI